MDYDDMDYDDAFPASAAARPEPAPAGAGPGRFRALRPLARRDFRILIGALSVSIFGSGMWAVTMVYQVIGLGGGPVELSLVATLAAAGLVAFVLLGGIAADRLPRRRILVLVEAVNLLALGSVTALALSGALQLWHLAVAAFGLGIASAFFFPAYSAILPRILPPEELLAANGMEGMIRPLLQQAAGPAAAGLIIAASSPAHAAALIAAAHATALLTLLLLRPEPPLDPEPHRGGPVAAVGPDGRTVRNAAGPKPARRSAWADLREGFGYTVRTPWLLWTLLFAVVAVLLSEGPIEVLLPFLVREQLGGGAQTFGFLLAIWGGAMALGALLVSSRPLPRRYLTVMITAWGLGTVPLAFIGFMDSFWQMAAVMLVVGVTWGAAQVIWGTLLQRRVPRQLLGRVSSLDFFVSLALMPVSMAAAGPLAAAVPIWLIFLVVSLATPVLGFIALLAARMPQDEIAHPLRS
ncbi:MFS transporter [Arthrobacter sp. I2-34]|uniref:MFS transporter n=1 Tax=Arthrobacter hankyongi TaxID=2904801 RepID=A0ABS9L5U1_9MICC|nr:MFS transporter [Arthrobacter hankyongi]MCG2622010.1 MFS transporter [Arthrobacter hankyongi]